MRQEESKNHTHTHIHTYIHTREVNEMGSNAEPAAGLPERSKLAQTLAGAFGGCVAGPAVDIALYPIDTVKTRLQSAEGFFKAGGFKGVYRGLSSAALGSAPAGQPPPNNLYFFFFFFFFFFLREVL